MRTEKGTGAIVGYLNAARANAEYDRKHGGKRIIQLKSADAHEETPEKPPAMPQEARPAKGRYLRRKTATRGEAAFVGYAGTQGDNPHTSREYPPWE